MNATIRLYLAVAVGLAGGAVPWFFSSYLGWESDGGTTPPFPRVLMGLYTHYFAHYTSISGSPTPRGVYLLWVPSGEVKFFIKIRREGVDGLSRGGVC